MVDWRLAFAGLALVSLVSIFSFVTAPSVAAADLKASWKDQSTLILGKDIYVATGISGNTMTLININQQCTSGTQKSTVQVGSTSIKYTAATKASAFLDIPCATGPVGALPVDITNSYPANADPNKAKGWWLDENHIAFQGTTYAKSKADSTTLTLKGSDVVCGESTLTDNNYSYPVTNTGTADDPIYGSFTFTPGKQPCNGIYSNDYFLANQYPGPQSSTSGGSNTNNCPIDGSTNLGWLLCPIFFLGRDAVNNLNTQIQNALYINTDQIFGTPSTPSSFQRSYNVFRNVGLTLLVMAGLVMVVSQAAGLEIFAAYTIKKTLPRIVIAAIGMSLAWPLLQFAITFFNDLGTWVSSIIMLAAQTSAGSTPESFSAVGNFAVNAGFFTVAGGVILVIFGIWGGLSFLLSFALMLLIAYIVIVIRQVVVLVCVLLAPLAIAASVLPGTKKLWDFWEDTLLGALLMFPIIMGFLASGAALSFILGQAASNASTVGGQGGSSQQALALMSVFVYFLPYIAIPFAFQMASGLMGRIFGMVNERGKGWFGRLSKYRSEQAAQNTHAFMSGSRYNPDHWTTGIRIGNRRYGFGSAVNLLGRHVGAGIGGRFGIGAVGAAAMAANATMTHEGAMKSSPHYAAHANDEAFLAAVAAGGNRQLLEEIGMSDTDINRGLAAARGMKITQQTQVGALEGLARSGKIIRNHQDLGRLLDSVSHGNEALRGMTKGNYQFISRQIGREDIGRDDAYAAIREMDIASIARQKPKSLENLFGYRKNPDGTNTTAVVQAMRQARTNGAPEEMQHIVDVAYAAQYNASLTPEQQQHILEGLREINTEFGNTYYNAAQQHYQDKLRSDRRLKKEITHLATLSNGTKLYKFRYIWGGPSYVGVMAQDLLATHPEAVSTDQFGYYTVDYAMLGLRMVHFSEWQVRPESIFRAQTSEKINSLLIRHK